MRKTVKRESTVIFHRDRDNDGHNNGVAVTGYKVFWPSGRQASLGFESFCKIGIRYIFGKRQPEWAKVRLIFHELSSREAPLPSVRPHRIRVLCLHRVGRRLHLLLPDGSVTGIAFDMDRDDPKALEWIGAARVADGGEQWFGFVAVTEEAVEGVVDHAYLPDSIVQQSDLHAAG